MSVYSFFDTSFGAMRARVRTAASNLLISYVMGRIDRAIPTCVHYMRGPGPKSYEWTEWRGRGDSSRDPQF